MARRSIEPLLWIMFSAGGVLAALFLPILVLLFGVAFPLGWVAAPTHDRLLSLIAHPLTRLGVFVVCLLSLIHGAHRLRYTLYDGLQIKHLNEVINAVCYGGAIATSIWGVYLLWNVASPGP
jgi:fumarate reductase subunit D